MVDEARQVAALGGVDDGVVVDAEQVTAANALLRVALLTHVGHHLWGDGGLYGVWGEYGALWGSYGALWGSYGGSGGYLGVLWGLCWA